MFRVFQFVYLSITNAKTADAKLAKGLQWAPVWSYRQSKSISWKHVWQKHHCKDGEEKSHNTEKLAKKYVGLVENLPCKMSLSNVDCFENRADLKNSWRPEFPSLRF